MASRSLRTARRATLSLTIIEMMKNPTLSQTSRSTNLLRFKAPPCSSLKASHQLPRRIIQIGTWHLIWMRQCFHVDRWSVANRSRVHTMRVTRELCQVSVSLRRWIHRVRSGSIRQLCIVWPSVASLQIPVTSQMPWLSPRQDQPKDKKGLLQNPTKSNRWCRSCLS